MTASDGRIPLLSRPRSLGVRGIILISLIGLVALGEQPGSAEPPDPLASLLEQFKGVQTLSATFVEEKNIALLSEPLVNWGQIDYSKPRRLERRTTKPFESLWRLDGHLVTVEDAGERTMIDLDEYPDALLLATAFMDVLEGDVDQLRKNFRVGFAPQHADTPWSIELTPLRNGRRALFRRIEISGLGVLVERLIIAESSGDKSTTNFSDVRIQPKSDDDRAKDTKGVR